MKVLADKASAVSVMKNVRGMACETSCYWRTSGSSCRSLRPTEDPQDRERTVRGTLFNGSMAMGKDAISKYFKLAVGQTGLNVTT